MPVQNRIFNAEPQGTRRKDFCLAERYRQIKKFLFLKARLIIGAAAIKWIDLNPQRDGVSAPIALSRLEQKKNLPLRPPRLCGEGSF